MLTETHRADRFIHYVNTDEQLLADLPTFTLLGFAQGHGSLKECSEHIKLHQDWREILSVVHCYLAHMATINAYPQQHSLNWGLTEPEN